MNIKPKIVLYEPTTKNFNNNGDFPLDGEIFNQEVKWNLLDSWYITFDYPVKNRLNIKFKRGQYIKANTPKFKEQLFYIEAVERNFESWTITAYHVYNKLKFTYILDSFVQAKNAGDAVTHLVTTGQSKYPFKGVTDTEEDLDNLRIVRMNALQAITDESLSNSVLTRYQKEFIANNFEIQLLDRVGKDDGVDIRFGRDLIEMFERVDYRDIVTGVQPIGFNGLTLPEEEGGPIIHLKDIEELSGAYDKELYYDEKTISVNYQQVKASIGEQAHDEDAIPLEDAYEILKQFAIEEFTINKIHEPHTSYDLDFIALSDYAQSQREKEVLENLQRIEPGDTIEVVGANNERVVGRVVAYSFDPLTERYITLTLVNRSPELTLQSQAERNLGQSMSNLEALSIRVDELEKNLFEQLGMINENGELIEALDDRVTKIENGEYDGFYYSEKENRARIGRGNNVNSGTNSLIAIGEDLKIKDDFVVAFGKNFNINQKSYPGSIIHGINTFEEKYEGKSIRYYKQVVTEDKKRATILRMNEQVGTFSFTSITGVATAWSPEEYNGVEDKMAVFDISIDYVNGLYILGKNIYLRSSRGDISDWYISNTGTGGATLVPLQVYSGEDKTMWQIHLDILTQDQYP